MLQSSSRCLLCVKSRLLRGGLAAEAIMYSTAATTVLCTVSYRRQYPVTLWAEPNNADKRGLMLSVKPGTLYALLLHGWLPQVPDESYGYALSLIWRSGCPSFAVRHGTTKTDGFRDHPTQVRQRIPSSVYRCLNGGIRNTTRNSGS